MTKLPRNANGLADLVVLEDGGVICVGRDGEAGFHDAANPRNSRSLSVEGRVTATALSHDGVKIWQMPADWQTRQTALVSKDTWQMPAVIQSLGFSPNGKLVAAGYGKTQVWDLQTKSKVFELPGQALSFSPDSSWLVTGGGTLAGTATIWDLSNGEPHLRLLGGHDNPISSVLFYNSRYVITGDSAGKLRCWNAGDGKISPDFPQPAAE